MTKAEKFLLGDRPEEDFDIYIYDLASEGNCKEFLVKKMKKYAEWYAQRCIEAVMGGKCVIESKVIKHTSIDNTFTVTTDLPEHE